MAILLLLFMLTPPATCEEMARQECREMGLSPTMCKVYVVNYGMECGNGYKD
jgi:hypothetical protein